jgi:uncharacterized FlaG/YvyC family protein
MTTDLSTIEHLPHPLTEERRAELSEQLVEALKTKEHLEEMKTRLAAEQTAQIKKRSTEIKRLTEELHNGVEMLPVACRTEHDIHRAMKKIVRIDTGAVVRELPMTQAELEDLRRPDPESQPGRREYRIPRS